MAFVGSPFQDYSTVNGRIEGHGKYVFSDGSNYVGEIKDGRFHGQGTMEFANGVKYTGHWADGETVDGKYTFSDGLEVNPQFQDWDYCTKQDRRYYIERVNGIQHSDHPQIQPPNENQKIPSNTYDVANGYFNPDDNYVYSYTGTQLRAVLDEERVWIMDNCYYQM